MDGNGRRNYSTSGAILSPVPSIFHNQESRTGGDSMPGNQGIGIIKGLFVWTGTYQRPRERVNPQLSLSNMRAFILRVGSDRPIVLG